MTAPHMTRWQLRRNKNGVRWKAWILTVCAARRCELFTLAIKITLFISSPHWASSIHSLLLSQFTPFKVLGEITLLNSNWQQSVNNHSVCCGYRDRPRDIKITFLVSLLYCQIVSAPINDSPSNICEANEEQLTNLEFVIQKVAESQKLIFFILQQSPANIKTKYINFCLKRKGGEYK